MRKLATAAAVSLALASGGAFGLGLGDIEMRSALNQPMNAEIRLTSVQTGELDGMIVQLASPEAFARAGIERSTALTDLRFTVDQSSGVPVIRISSQRPVIEPFLNFLLEVDWPQGRMVREYTVLLDPPVFMTPTATERNTTQDQPAVVQRGNEALILPTPINRSGEGVEVDLAGLTGSASAEAGEALRGSVDEGEIVSLELIPDDALIAASPSSASDAGEVVSLTDLSAPNSAALEEREQFLAEQRDRLAAITVELAGSVEEVSDTAVVDGANGFDDDGSTIVSLQDLTPAIDSPTTRSTAGQRVTVGQGDTLYEIAKDVSGSSTSVQQMMMALLAANESAFINRNINLVKAGSVLRVPDAGDANRLTQEQALAAIGQQNQLWQEYRDKLTNPGNTRIASGTRTDIEAPLTSDTTAIDTTAIDTAAIDPSALDPELSSPSIADGLSDEARAILENARNEILGRDELRIVADSAPTSTTASATADETTDNDASRLGEVNLKLQLAREELSATRLQADELADQANELQGTTENLDALVSLRQNEIARLESQLAEARQASAEAETSASSLVADAADALGDTASEAADSVAQAAEDAEDALSNVMVDASDAATDTLTEAGEVVDSGVNALTEAGEELAEVELLGDDEPLAVADSVAVEADITPPQLQSNWFQDFINDPKRMAIAGIGGVGLLGVIGTLMFRRRRRDEEDWFDIDESEFDEEELDDRQDSHDRDRKVKEVDLSGVGLAGAAAAGAAAGRVGSAQQDEAAFDESPDLGQEFATESQAIAMGSSDNSIDQDDTIAEVDVYLAYGLHGQAEELLSRATERDPNNQVYAIKLLETYHAQGNADGFNAAARNFQARFGGESNPEWQGIAAMGAELRPADELYSAARDTVDRIGSGDSDGVAMSDEDFLPAHESDSGSVNRGFGSSDAVADFTVDDEASLLDQSIDPAFAFDEDDLEATGDFSGIAAEIAAEEGSIDFPGYDLANTVADEAAERIEPELPDIAGNADGFTAEGLSADGLSADGLSADATGDLANELSADLTNGDELLGDALTMDELDRVASIDDLTLDLDQLSGDLDLDSSQLTNSDLSDLELPDLTADNELFLDGAGGVDNSDEMETMLDLAKAYIDMGDKDSASSALDEIVKSGNPEQVTEAETLLRNIS